MQDLVILGGANPDAIQLLYDLKTAGNGWNLIGILDDRIEKGTSVLGLPVLGQLDAWRELGAGTYFAQSIVSRPQTARSIVERLKIPLERFPNLIHPGAWVAREQRSTAILGHGNLVLQGASLQPQAVLGNFNYVNLNCVIGHDSVVGNFNSFGVAAVVTGRCRMGDACYVGSNSVLTNECILEDECFVCAGTIVSRTLQKGTKVMGNPFRVLPNL